MKRDRMVLVLDRCIVTQAKQSRYRDRHSVGMMGLNRSAVHPSPPAIAYMTAITTRLMRAIYWLIGLGGVLFVGLAVANLWVIYRSPGVVTGFGVPVYPALAAVGLFACFVSIWSLRRSDGRPETSARHPVAIRRTFNRPCGAGMPNDA